MEPFPTAISSPLNGGVAFAGNNGRKTANVCETNATETTAISAAHFINSALLSESKNIASKILAYPAVRKTPRSLVVQEDRLSHHLNRAKPDSSLRFNVSDYCLRLCHSFPIVLATRRAVWLKAYSIARIGQLRFGKLNCNTMFRSESKWSTGQSRRNKKGPRRPHLKGNCGCWVLQRLLRQHEI